MSIDQPATVSATIGQDRSLEALARTVAAARPVEAWNPPDCGDINIRIRADGVWEHLGRPILRPALVELFASILRREPDGRYCLVTPVEKMGIRVDDLPFLAVELAQEGEARDTVLSFRLGSGGWVTADADHPLTFESDPATGAPRPALLVRRGLWARLSRPVFYELATLALEALPPGESTLEVWSAGHRFPLGAIDDSAV